MSDFTVSCSCGRVMVTDTMRGRDAFRCGCGARVLVKTAFGRHCGGRIGGRPCQAPLLAGLPVDLCADHAAELKHLWLPDPAKAEEARIHLRDRLERSGRGYMPVVYYLLFAGRIKIGMTINLAHRLQSLPHDDLLGAEFGGRDLERQRHEQFRKLRLTGEWFCDDPSLRKHIKTLPSIDGLLRAPVPQRHHDMDSLAGILLLAREVAVLTGVHVRTVYQWERRGYLKARGLDECGNRLYDAGEAAMVASSPRRRNAA